MKSRAVTVAIPTRSDETMAKILLPDTFCPILRTLVEKNVPSKM